MNSRHLAIAASAALILAAAPWALQAQDPILTGDSALNGDREAPTAADRLRDDLPVVTVGPYGDCDYSSLRTALLGETDDAQFNVVKTGDYVGDTHGLERADYTALIEGGYDDCDPDGTPSGRTVLDADGEGPVFIFNNSSTDGPLAITLRNLEIRGGEGVNLFGGGGILVWGRQGVVSASLENVEVTNNEANGGPGGGISVFMDGERVSFGVVLTMDNDSEISSNSAGTGGGLSCVSVPEHVSGPLIRLGTVDIRDNHAEIGGGISIVGCTNVFYYGGDDMLGPLPQGGLWANEASEKGGGLAVRGGGSLFVNGGDFNELGNPDYAAQVFQNEAPLGGAAYIAGGTVEHPDESSLLRFFDVWMSDNIAAEKGGGVFVDDGGQMDMIRTEDEPCDMSGDITPPPRCSWARQNRAGNTGGAFYLTGLAESGNPRGTFEIQGGQLDIERTLVVGNEAEGGANTASVLDMDTDEPDLLPAQARFESSLFYENDGYFLMQASGNAELELGWSTITDNEISFGVFSGMAPSDFELDISVHSSIIWEDGPDLLSIGGQGNRFAEAYCLITFVDADQADFDSISQYSNTDPQLTDEPNRPYIPDATSPAIDYCDDAFEPETPDLAGVERGSPHEGPPINEPPSGGIGDYDIGAYETEWDELGDEIFEDRFEES